MNNTPVPTAAGELIILIEDDAQLRRFLRASLTGSGYQLIEARNGQDGILQISTHKPDLIILDLGLPDTDGVEVTKQVREWSQVPILVLSAREQEKDRVIALDAGADDYLTKPFGMGELLARIRAALRRGAQSSQPTETPDYILRGLRVDFVRRQVFINGEEIHLTPIEYKLLTVLVHYAGKVITRDRLLKEVWGPGYTKEIQYLRVYMGHLRNKIETDPTHPEYLITEPGVGYRLKAD